MMTRLGGQLFYHKGSLGRFIQRLSPVDHPWTMLDAESTRLAVGNFNIVVTIQTGIKGTYISRTAGPTRSSPTTTGSAGRTAWSSDKCTGRKIGCSNRLSIGTRRTPGTTATVPWKTDSCVRLDSTALRKTITVIYGSCYGRETFQTRHFRVHEIFLWHLWCRVSFVKAATALLCTA